MFGEDGDSNAEIKKEQGSEDRGEMKNHSKKGPKKKSN